MRFRAGSGGSQKGLGNEARGEEKAGGAVRAEEPERAGAVVSVERSDLEGEMRREGEEASQARFFAPAIARLSPIPSTAIA